MTILSDNVVNDILKGLIKYSNLVNPEGCLRETLNGPASFTSIARLDLEVSQIESLLALFQDSVRFKTTTLRRRRNLLAPVYRLPPELLVEIFQNVQLSEERTPSAYHALRRLAEVTSHWFSVVLSTPSLWTHLDSECHTMLTKSAIFRSKGSPLHLYCSGRDSSGSKDSFLTMVIPHVSRWKTFQGYPRRNMAQLDGLSANTQMDSLECLEVFSIPESEILLSDIPEIILQRTPRLQTLSIQRCSFPLGATVLSKVRKLKFTPTNGGAELSSHQWQIFLSGSLQLEHLHVVGPVRSPRDEPITLSAVLPSLRTITLEDLSAFIAGGLLNSICLPSDQQAYPYVEIQQTCRFFEAHEFDILFPKLHQCQSLLWLIRSMSWMTIKCRTYSDNVEIRAGTNPDTPFLSIRCSHSRCPGAVLETLVSSTCLPTLKSLSIDGPPFFAGEAFIRKLHCFPALRKLNLSSPNWDTDDLLYHDNLTQICWVLSSPIIEGDEVRSYWLLPQLTELTVKSTDAFEALIPLIKSRCRLVNQPEQSNAPAALEVLQLRPTMGLHHDAPRSLDPGLVERLLALFKDRTAELLMPLPLQPQSSEDGSVYL